VLMVDVGTLPEVTAGEAAVEGVRWKLPGVG